MQTKVEKTPKATIKLTVTVEADKVKEAYEKVLDKAVAETTIQGFRIGTAPKELVKDKVGTDTLYGDAVNIILQTFYPQALKENLIMPISNPHVEIKEFSLDKDFEFTATVATMPEVKMQEYKEELKKRYAAKIEEAKKNLKEGEELHVHIGPNEIIATLMEKSEVEFSDLLLEEETERLLSRLVNQAQSIGLSVEQYLKSQNKTPEELHSDYQKIAERNLKAEFVLAHLVKTEKVEVSDEEIQEAIAAVSSEEQKSLLDDKTQMIYVKSILQKNKLITKLIEETEGENHHEHEHKE